MFCRLIGKGPSLPNFSVIGLGQGWQCPLRSLNPIAIQFSTSELMSSNTWFTDEIQVLIYNNSSTFPTNGPQQIVII